jgi:hypothetical protein
MAVDETGTGTAQAGRHCRWNRVMGVAAYGRAAQRCRQTIGTRRRLRMRYSMPSPCSATQARCHSVQAQGWTRGDGGGTAPYEMLESPCGNRAMRAGAAVVFALHRRRDVGEFWAWRVLLSCLSSAWAPRTGLRCGGHGVCSVCRMNPVGADHLRAQGDLTWRKGSQRLKESTAAPSWTH